MEVRDIIHKRVILKPSAELLTDVFLSHLNKELTNSNNVGINMSLNIYADGTEGVIYTPSGKYEIFPELVGEYFELVPDVFFVIRASTMGLGIPFMDVDADYSHDNTNEYDPGEIEVTISLPPKQEQIQEYIPKLRKKIYPVLVHEMQHTIQKIIYGQYLSGSVISTLEAHMSDISEIDARVEEILSMTDSYPRGSDMFHVELCGYVKRYLARNMKKPYDDNEFLDLEKKMIQEHMNFYNKKILHNN